MGVFPGADLICAETVMNPMQLVTDEQAQNSVDEIKWLFTLRYGNLKVQSTLSRHFSQE